MFEFYTVSLGLLFDLTNCLKDVVVKKSEE